MQQQNVKIRSIKKITRDVLQIITEKPQSFIFAPGQATEISIGIEGWQDKKKPFTFTSLPANDYLEFIIKTYPSHKGITNQLLNLKAGDELILHDVFGTINYQGEGMFIAGGAGVTPFISILRDLESKNQIGNNQLIFANKAKVDIILEQELNELLEDNLFNILSEEDVRGYATGFITEEFISKNTKDLNKVFYVCGPPPMIDKVEKQLVNLGVNEKSIIKESF